MKEILKGVKNDPYEFFEFISWGVFLYLFVYISFSGFSEVEENVYFLVHNYL